MSRPLPYSKYSWSFTQHAIGLKASTLFKLLKIAAVFEGRIDANGTQITALMVHEGLLTANERDGKPDAWRDYQQILAEVGLIYSTRLVNPIRITPIGRLFLSGGIGFSELMGLQALRFQYPSGQKSQLSPDVRVSLGAHVRPTLTESQAELGILLKPAVLILRILLELLSRGHNETISADECLAYLLPCKSNSEWPAALSAILHDRTLTVKSSGENPHARRNIQDWFKFLQHSDFFVSSDGQSIGLSEFAATNADWLLSVCARLELPAAFWIPTDFSTSGRVTWFDWFGSVDSSAVDLTRSEDVDESYIEKNYVEGVDEPDTEFGFDDPTRPIVATPINLERLRDPSNVPLFGADSTEAISKLRQGILKRHAKTVLHNLLVAELAEALQATGAEVQEDQNSVDILATWDGVGDAIFEVKTASRRSLPNRMRLAVGQIQEYAYRSRATSGRDCDKVIAVNTPVNESSWYREFLVEDLSIGLICLTPERRYTFAPQGFITRKRWVDSI